MSDETPLFPLRAVLFPGGHLPLQIFEPRYLDMVQRCQAQGRPFGVVALTEGREVRQREGEGFRREGFHEVGTLAVIDELVQLQAGLLRVTARGTQRFRVQSARCLSHGLWVGQLALLPDEPAVTVPADLRHAVRPLQDLLAGWAEQAAAEDLPIQPPHAWDDAGWLSNRWAELLPMPQEERQRLMTLDSPLLRLELVVDRLDALKR